MAAVTEHRLICGEAQQVLSGLEPQKFQCVVTSPPYFGLRDYGSEGQIGLEETPAEYIDSLVSVFREVWRVLRNDGTVWLNIGDSYAGYHGNKNAPMPTSATNGWTRGTNENMRTSTAGRCAKPKDLLMIPARVALALQADGWYLRSDIIWAKPNPMPESVTDRPTSAHEHVFLLTKDARYFYDAEAVKEESVYGDHHEKYSGTYRRHKVESLQQNGAVNKEQYQRGLQGQLKDPRVKNLRNVWHISSKSYSGAHFAVFPVALPTQCIKAGSEEDDCVLDPFGGSGTVCIASGNLGRNSVMIDLQSEYIKLAKKRVATELGFRGRVSVEGV